MIAIVNRRPMQLGLIAILDAYIAHQREVVTKRTSFDLAHAKKRYHIVEGLIKAISILDEVIKTIRASKNKADAIENLMIKYEFTEEQATEIVNLQLYRLTNTDIVILQEEENNLEKIMAMLEAILASPEKLNTVIKEELKKIKKEYATPRRTTIVMEAEEIKIDATEMIPKEDTIVVVTKEGYIKRVSVRGYEANTEATGLKEGDYVIGLYNINTASGDIKSEIDLLENKININTTSGDVTLKNIYLANIHTTSGSIKINDVNEANIGSTSGDVYVKGETKKLDIKTTSGDMEINKVNDSLNLLAISGRVKINTLNIIDNSSISTTSGDVFVGNNLSNCYVEFSTITGDRYINKSDRKSDIVLKVNTVSGDIRVN